MPSEMVRRVARVLADQWDGWDAMTPDKRERFYADARAAISAMREPTREMVIAGSVRYHEPQLHGEVRLPYLSDEGSLVWERAIDAALKE